MELAPRASYQRIFGISFFNAGTANTNERFSSASYRAARLLPDADMWALNIFNPAGTGETVSSTTPIDQQSFLLVRLDYGSGLLADNAYLWVNPNLGLGEPSIGSAQASLIGRNLEFDRLRVSAGGSNSSTEQPNGAILAASGLLDEIRVGNNFASVIGPGLIPGDVNGDLIVRLRTTTSSSATTSNKRTRRGQRRFEWRRKCEFRRFPHLEKQSSARLRLR